MDEKEENNETKEENLTEDEKEEKEETNETVEEAHESGEFNFLREALENINAKIDKLTETVNNGFSESAAIAVESGETITEADKEENAEVANLEDDDFIVVPGIEELDLSID